MKWLPFITILLWSWSFVACNLNRHASLDRVASQLEGNWINQKYLDTLRLTKSPQRAHQATPIRGFYIQRDTFDAPLHVVLSFQDGDDWLLQRNDDGLVFSSAYDATLQLSAELLPPKRLRLGNEVFIRCSDDLEDDGQAYALVEKELFAGRYEWNGKFVDFAVDGQIIGMEEEGIEAYDPIVDYYGNTTTIDLLWLQKNGEPNRYAFEFKDKKLCIYQLKCASGDSYCVDDFQLGDLVFELKAHRALK